MRKILFIDTETTGLDPHKNGIIQVSGIIEIDGDIKEEFNIKCQPMTGDAVDAKALEVTGTTHEMIQSYISGADGYRRLVSIFDKYVSKFDKNDKFQVVGYNVRYDMEMLKSWFDKNGNPYMGSYMTWQPFDVMSVCHMLKYMGVLNLPNYKLSTLCEHFGITIKAHDAMSDITATRELSRVLLSRITYSSISK